MKKVKLKCTSTKCGYDCKLEMLYALGVDVNGLPTDCIMNTADLAIDNNQDLGVNWTIESVEPYKEYSSLIVEHDSA